MDKKKILLVVPNFRWRKAQDNLMWHYLPYGLCMVAAMVEKTYEVKILDAYTEDLSEEEFYDKILAERPDIVGVTVLIDYFGVTMHRAFDIVKSVDREIITVAGGVYATTNVEKVIADQNVDFLIAGEGEFAFQDILAYCFQTDDKNLGPGIYYKKSGQVLGAGITPLIMDLDMLPKPTYQLIDFSQYINRVSRNGVDRPPARPFGEIFTSRGCPYNCCFCQVNRISSRKFRGRSAENVLEEIDWLIKLYGIKSVVFMDDNFLTDRKRAVMIIEGLRMRKIPWKMVSTAVFLLDEELLALMKESGCTYLNIAVESGTYRVLHEVIHKPIKSLDRVVELVKVARELGIYVAANFIVGFPTETWDEIRETVQFSERLGADYVKIFNAVPLPHTEMYEEAIKLGCVAEGYNSENIDWKTGMIETKEFTVNDLTILRAYEWDRINFTDSEKRKKTAAMMEITEEELNVIRKQARSVVKDLLS